MECGGNVRGDLYLHASSAFIRKDSSKLLLSHRELSSLSTQLDLVHGVCCSNVRVISVSIQRALHSQGLLQVLLSRRQISSLSTQDCLSAWSVAAISGWALSPCVERFMRKDSSKCCLAKGRSPACWLNWPSAWIVAAISGWALSPMRRALHAQGLLQVLLSGRQISSLLTQQA